MKIVRLSVTVGDRGKRRAARGWLAVGLHVFTHAHVSMITYRVDVYRSGPIGASPLCLVGHGLHCSSLK